MKHSIRPVGPYSPAQVRRLLVVFFCAAFLVAPAFAQATTPTVAAVQNAGDFSTHLCPGLIVAIYGTNFGAGPTSSVTVTVAGKQAYVAKVTDSQLTVQLPTDAPAGATTLVATVNGVASPPLSISLDAYAPAFATADGTGKGPALILTAKGVQVTAAAPAQSGDTLVGYAIGLGPTNPATPTGPAGAANKTATTPTLTVGGVAAAVAFAGAFPGQPGEYQINFTVPAGVQGTVPVVLTVGGFSSSSSVTLALSTTAAGPTVSGVLNGGDFSTHLCPGVVVQIFGTNFGTAQAGVSLSVGGKQGFVIKLASSNILVAQLPVDAPSGATTLIVTAGGVASAPFSVTLDAYAPSVVAAGGTGSGPGLFSDATGKSASFTATAPSHGGDSLSLFAFGLGPTTPATPTGAATAANPAATAPVLTIGGISAAISFAGVAPGQAGLYQVNFKIPVGVQGTQPVVLSVGGKTSTTSVTIAVFGISYLENNASFALPGTISPGSIASVFANGLGSTDQTTGGPATTMQGVSVTFNGTPAPLFHMIGSAGQIDLLVPYELPTTGTVTVQVTTPSGPSLNYTLNMAATSPGIYYLADPATKNRFNVIAQFNNTAWLAMPTSMATAFKLPLCTASTSPLVQCGQPATAGDYLVLYTTGLGKATPGGDPNGAQLKTGSVPPADGSVLYQTPVPATVTVGGQPAKVVFSGIAPGFPGEYQVDFQVPSGVTGDDVPVVVTIGGASDTRTIGIR